MRFTARSISLLLMLVLLAALGGCNTPVAIRYTPIAAVETIAQDSATAPRVYVMRFVDKRTPADVIGENQNVYGMKINDVRTTDDLPLITAEAMTDCLRKAGIKSDLHPERTAGEAVPDAEASKYDFVITGEITRFWVSTKPGWNTVDATAEMTIKVCIRHAGKEEWVGPVNGTAKQGTLATDLSSCMTQAMDSAIGNCMRATIQHLSASGSLRRTTP